MATALDAIGDVAAAFGGPVGILVKLATAVPSLMKYAHAPDSATEIATEAVELAKQVTGKTNGVQAVNQIALGDPTVIEEFRQRTAQRLFEWDQAILADVQSARNRDIELTKAGYVNKRGNYLAVIAFVIVIGIFISIMSNPDLNEWTKGIIVLLLGRFLGYIDQIYSFEYGSTRASKTKDDTIAALSKE